jgi:uncharacterized membrane protein YdjX (TVP38/TMEM64 family)
VISGPEATAATTRRKGSKTKVALWIIVVVALLAAARYFNAHALLRQALDTIAGLGPWGPVMFVLLYIVATVFFLPGSILTLGAGFVFGVIKGAILVSIAATLGATAAFLVGRYLARDWVGKKIEGNVRFKAIDEAVAREGWKIVGLTRLSPVFPFNLLNYAFGLTRVSLRDYFFASWIGMMPGTLMYVYLGSLAGDLAAVGGGGHTRTTAESTLYVVGLLATVAVTVYVTRLARQALQQRIEQ